MTSYSSTRAHLNREQRRRMAAAAPSVDKIIEGDAAFFKRFSHRIHRLRLMGAAEREQLLAMDAGKRAGAGAGEAWAVAVRELAPGARLRRFFLCAEGTDLDQPEAVAAATFEHLSRGDLRTALIEAQVRRVIEANKRGGAH